MVDVDTHLGKHCDFLLFKWENIDVPLPYFSCHFEQIILLTNICFQTGLCNHF